jgi:hypothetical protein
MSFRGNERGDAQLAHAPDVRLGASHEHIGRVHVSPAPRMSAARSW